MSEETETTVTTDEKLLEEQEALRRKQQKIIDLRSELSSPVSDIGDWKMAKIYEARLKGEPDPYNAEELSEAREKVRAEITALEKELGQTAALTDAEQKAQNLNELDTGYARAKESTLLAYVAADMSGNTDLQTSLKEQLTSLDTTYDAQRKELE